MSIDKQIEDLCLANKILFSNRVVDAFGHVSVRTESRETSFLLSRNRAPSLVSPEDILEFDFDGTPLKDGGAALYLERYIHGSIYRARPDVHAVVHSHAHSVIPFGASRRPLRPLWHMCGFLAPVVPVYEIRDFAGLESDMLIRSKELGDSLASELGNASVVLMRGHGATIVGSSLYEAVFRSIYTKANAEIQLAAEPLGDLEFLNEAEAANATAANAGQVNRAWNLWCDEVRGNNASGHS